MQEKVKFMVVDDHPIFRRGAIALIESEPRYRVCAEAGSIGEALPLIERERPDLLLLDITLQEENGLDLLRTILSSHPNIKALIVSIHDEAVYAERALRAKARGYIMKHEASSVLKEAIRTILDGRIYVSESFRDHILESVAGAPKESFRAKASILSDRELEVLEYIGRGYGATEIAGLMGIAVKTVGVYQDHIKRKLALGSTSELRKFSIRWVKSA
jgi:DNA-binding NarL/FixJ family response regulator